MCPIFWASSNRLLNCRKVFLQWPVTHPRGFPSVPSVLLVGRLSAVKRGRAFFGLALHPSSLANQNRINIVLAIIFKGPTTTPSPHPCRSDLDCTLFCCFSGAEHDESKKQFKRGPCSRAAERDEALLCLFSFPFPYVTFQALARCFLFPCITKRPVVLSSACRV